MRFPKTASPDPRAPMLLVLAAALSGCFAGPLATPRAGVTPTAIENLPDTPDENVERLARLAAARRAERRATEYVLGEGDLIVVKAVGVDELTQQVRVEGDGTVTLPLLGTVTVAEKTVAEVQRDLTAHLGEFMYDPHVGVFVEEYRSHQVGVVGAVQRPGLVSLTTPGATVIDAISAAGGMTAEAGGGVYLIPAESRVPDEACVMSATISGDVPQCEDAAAPIVFDLKEFGQTVQRMFFELPVRAGDVVMVPGAGEFVLDGWVIKPGSYPLKSTVTLRGAIAMAGGLSFPADTAHVRIHRVTSDGATDSQEIDYGAIVAGDAPDVFVHDGDVIEVRSSAIKLVPYSLYHTITDLIRFGAGVRVAP